MAVTRNPPGSSASGSGVPDVVKVPEPVKPPVMVKLYSVASAGEAAKAPTISAIGIIFMWITPK
jgi:hypothetical protein